MSVTLYAANLYRSIVLAMPAISRLKYVTISLFSRKPVILLNEQSALAILKILS
jgi:hypothetical protein